MQITQYKFIILAVNQTIEFINLRTNNTIENCKTDYESTKHNNYITVNIP